MDRIVPRYKGKAELHRIIDRLNERSKYIDFILNDSNCNTFDMFYIRCLSGIYDIDITLCFHTSNINYNIISNSIKYNITKVLTNRIELNKI